MADVKKILICRIDDDDRVLKELKDVLEGAGVEVRDDIVPIIEPNDLGSAEKVQCESLAPRVDWADALIVLIEANRDESCCVNWEIEYAVKHGKRVVGVYGEGAGKADMPSALQVCGDATVHSSRVARIVDIINSDIPPEETWPDPETGKPREPEWPIERHKC